MVDDGLTAEERKRARTKRRRQRRRATRKQRVASATATRPDPPPDARARPDAPPQRTARSTTNPTAPADKTGPSLAKVSLGRKSDREPSPTGARRRLYVRDPIRRDLATAHEARNRRQIGDAIKLYERVLGVEPQNLDALTGLGFTYLAVDDFENALRYLEKALDGGGDLDGGALYGAAVALLNLERFPAAIEYASRLSEISGNDNQVRYHGLLGRIFYERGMWLEAAEQLEQRIALTNIVDSRGDRRASHRLQQDRFRLSETYIELNRPEQALEQLDAMLNNRWTRAIQDQIGRLCLQLGRHQNAKDAFARVLAEDPNDVRALIGLAQSRLGVHEYDEAIAAFARVLEAEPNSLQALDGLAEAYRNKGDLEKAAAHIEQARRFYNLPEAQTQRRLRRLDEERARRDAELLRIRNIASLNVMATGIAHELRQPLSVIRLAAQNAKRDIEGGQYDLLAEDLHDIDEHVGRIDRVIRLLRDMGRPSRPDDTVSTVPLHRAVERALELFREQFANRGVALEIEHLQHHVLANEDALVQILVNLISNARDAVTASTTKRIRIWAAPGLERTSLYVMDSGEGMTPDIRRQAFDPFFTTKKEEGIGVGLYIAFNLARQMQGRLTIRETRPLRGTTFELSLRSGGTT